MPIIAPLSALMRLLAGWRDRRYDPSRHYMRGPGPATRARKRRAAASVKPTDDRTTERDQ